MSARLYGGRREIVRRLCVGFVFSLILVAFAAPTTQASPIDSYQFGDWVLHQAFADGAHYEEQHGEADPFGFESQHYLQLSGGPTLPAGQHYAWFGATPATPGPITIQYDFRSQSGFANSITGSQIALAEQAMDLWSNATGGKLQFQQNTGASPLNIINIGVGDLAALGGSSGAGGVIGLGGGALNPTTATLSAGVAWLDFAESFDEILGNGNPGGFEFFTLVAHEIGHALGMGHIDALPNGPHLMNTVHPGELLAPSATDVALLQSIYGHFETSIPEPGMLAIFCVTIAALAVIRHRRDRSPIALAASS